MQPGGQLPLIHQYPKANPAPFSSLDIGAWTSLACIFAFMCGMGLLWTLISGLSWIFEGGAVTPLFAFIVIGTVAMVPLCIWSTKRAAIAEGLLSRRIQLPIVISFVFGVGVYLLSGVGKDIAESRNNENLVNIAVLGDWKCTDTQTGQKFDLTMFPDGEFSLSGSARADRGRFEDDGATLRFLFPDGDEMNSTYSVSARSLRFEGTTCLK